MFFSAKIQYGRQRPLKIVAYEEFNIYFFVIPLFQLIFHGELISGLLFKYSSLIRVLFAKIQNGRLIQY